MGASPREVALVSSFYICPEPEDKRCKASKFMIDTGAGVIDADYRGTVFVLLYNYSDTDFKGTFQIHVVLNDTMLNNFCSGRRRPRCPTHPRKDLYP